MIVILIKSILTYLFLMGTSYCCGPTNLPQSNQTGLYDGDPAFSAKLEGSSRSHKDNSE